MGKNLEPGSGINISGSATLVVLIAFRSKFVKHPFMKETPRRRIMVTSSLKEMSTDQMGNWVVMRGMHYSARPFLQQASGSIFKDDLKGQ